MKLEGVSKYYAETVALKDFSLRLLPGETLCLMGRSGCGKSTVLNLIMGLTQPDAGRVEGFESMRIAAVFQEDRLIGTLSARENVRLVAEGRSSALAVDEALGALGLEGAEDQSVHTLSGGQRRRVAIARAMLATSELLALDEPFKGLDEATRAQAASFIRERAAGKTTLLVTHDRAEAALLGATRIVEMK